MARQKYWEWICLTQFDPVEYSGGTIKTGYSVTDQKSYGDVYFNSREITIKGNCVEFHGGTNVELGTELKIETIPTY